MDITLLFVTPYAPGRFCSPKPLLMKNLSALAVLGLFALLSGCVSSTPEWKPVSEATEAEYQRYMAGGNGSLVGEASVTPPGKNTVKASGKTVTLDPATSVGEEWWAKAGTHWKHRTLTPPSPMFLKARRSANADSEGRFEFTGLAPGSYFLRTEVTWEVGYEIQGVIVGTWVEIHPGETARVTMGR